MGVIQLRIWNLGPADWYDIQIETANIQDAAAQRGWDRYHLYGFSAGATVALAATLTNPDAVRSVAMFEPASIGDDDWGPVETRWRAELAQVRILDPALRQDAFRRMLMGDAEKLPAHLRPAQPWDALSDKLEDMLAGVGFDSVELGRIGQPTLIMSGGRSAARFAAVADRLVQVMPNVKAELMPDCSHLDLPHRSTPDQLRQTLFRLSDRS
ncbi:MAG: alpha/beta hydrolase [Microlunatus sp.]|nr:alpha/beta hydrolase [Microlunatus sp.]